MIKKFVNMSKEIIFKKDRGASQLIIEIGLVVIAVFFIVIFRSQIKDIFDAVFKEASTTIKNLFNGNSGTSTNPTA